VAFNKNYFAEPSLMAVKKLARYLCSGYEAQGREKRSAACFAVRDIHRRFPEFVTAWERINGITWKGDDWFASRIDHQSNSQHNKTAHIPLEEFVKGRIANNSVYAWDQWEAMVLRVNRPAEIVLDYKTYLLPFRVYTTTLFDIQKVGITNNTTQRLAEYRAKTPFSIQRTGEIIVPARRFIMTCELGLISKREAEWMEDKLKGVLNESQPPEMGREWFRMSAEEAITRTRKLLRKEGFSPLVYRCGVFS
jgi:hypothetical protein